jgi:hypothetical protein
MSLEPCHRAEGDRRQGDYGKVTSHAIGQRATADRATTAK